VDRLAVEHPVVGGSRLGPAWTALTAKTRLAMRAEAEKARFIKVPTSADGLLGRAT
jgi:hypothetical protein